LRGLVVSLDYTPASTTVGMYIEGEALGLGMLAVASAMAEDQYEMVAKVFGDEEVVVRSFGGRREGGRRA
jgi:nitroreductase